MDTCNDAEPRANAVDEPLPSVVMSNTTPSPTGASPQTSNALEKDFACGRVMGDTLSSALDLYYSARYAIASPRLLQTHFSSKLRAGSRYRGTQTSDQQRYNVEVMVKSIDMSESFICGYLKIEGHIARTSSVDYSLSGIGLTPEHATLTTYFEGEIIGSKYTFQTRHESWGASEKDDLKHWGHFASWRPLARQAKKNNFHYKHSEAREHIYMRWKEKFLVPDHRVKEISGASFEGFYYICFNQVAGIINGIYYHSKTDTNQNNRVQNLDLDWVPDSGCYAAMEFR
ncbi:uncharacterized protein KY384_002113 [Bacidia gigantensis]|uniref:uncharacterized protein n=1 Tax=Bacidia gigantensis TaxID=2732470 RepID=UPI001D045F0B|nr:uncharacterized protein KY384_002113 [Bacidia gigantensis]KAG8533330.1 hypothetical protein KY384_002113 [Bacidia gigantensis]